MNDEAPKWREVVALRAELLGTLLLIPTLIGFFGGEWWGFDLFSHFRVQYALGALLCFVLSLLRPTRLVVAVAFTAGINGVQLLPGRDELVPAVNSSAPLTVLSYNLNTLNENKAEAAAYIAGSGADVVFAIEVGAGWLETLKKIEGYRVVVARPAGDNFGMAALAKTTVTSTQVHVFSKAMVPSIELTVPRPEGNIVLLGVHPIPPVSAEAAAMRDAEFAQIARWSKRQVHPHVVLGDFNATQWSAPFSRMLNEGRLIVYSGLSPTWPYGVWMLAPFRIPIDHALYSPDLGVTKRVLGPSHGSDHRPMVVTFVRVRPH